jgi:hypothetical protein
MLRSFDDAFGQLDDANLLVKDDDFLSAGVLLGMTSYLLISK